MTAYALDPTSPFAIYPPTAKVYHTSTTLTASPDRMHYINIYMDNLICANQGGAAQQHRILDLTLCTIKKIFPSVPGEIKYLTSLKKGLARNWGWKTTKEILVWVVDTNKVTLWLSMKHKTELLYLHSTPPSRRRMAVKSLERLVGKLRSMHLEVPGAIGHFYAMKVALTCSSHRATAYLSE